MVKKIGIVLLVLAEGLWSSCLFSETIFNPVSRHTQYQSYGLFFDPQSLLVVRDRHRGWGAIGGSAALVEFSHLKWEPQYVLHASAHASYDFISEAGTTLHTETIDARVGIAVDLKFSEIFRGSIIWTHQSGHISDNVPDRSLMGPDLSNELIEFRLIRDIRKNWRWGGGFRPVVLSNPTISFLGAEQFLEWFPKGVHHHHFSPFMAVGLEEYGVDHMNVTFHTQMGWVVGDHFAEGQTQAFRLAVGYYNGEDPRLKFFQFKHGKDQFIYAGIFFDL